jgi:hypothetical protein
MISLSGPSPEYFPGLDQLGIHSGIPDLNFAFLACDWKAGQESEVICKFQMNFPATHNF